jgi:hypothetical protein
LAAAVLRAILPIIASISETTRSGATIWIMWPTPGSTISFAFGAVAASGREWIWVDRDDRDRRLDLPIARRLLGDGGSKRHQVARVGDEFLRP